MTVLFGLAASEVIIDSVLWSGCSKIIDVEDVVEVVLASFGLSDDSVLSLISPGVAGDVEASISGFLVILVEPSMTT